MPNRWLDDLAGELPAAELERLVMDGSKLLAQVHSISATPTAASGTNSSRPAAKS